MAEDIAIVTVDSANFADLGYFCRKSKMKTPGNLRKLDWLAKRLGEGLRIHILFESGRSVGFIEYVPAKYSWRPVCAPGYLLIHCLWVVGRAKGKGYGSRLIDVCLEEAEATGTEGVAMVSSSRVWLAGADVFLKKGFAAVDEAPPCFELLAYRLGDGPTPAFPTNWNERAARFGTGLTVLRTDQCPYIDDAVNMVVGFAQEMGIETRVVEFASSEEARELSPSAYGTMGVVYDGRLLSYHYLNKEHFQQALARVDASTPPC